ncbi:MAG: DUF4258 domain-containing protein [Candidatus Accumulibacter sp.]|uniref:DUF4258 domain-containing protein n=1 Tax=Accumulibacter sp. TaxID=2053492 RepID=UPI001AC4E5CB|nr:DUF4258 domain-containing protein [Accumulibacter sp.]MBN8520003.1 DUF4258 domain-containing protein [Accumulibacter sp.]MBO3712144.1 DUF4258 domain-containing protein [Accumulibacter sp.]MCM8623945.1 DUF4258 domain-containing protein [Accumulibacter sp.]
MSKISCIKPTDRQAIEWVKEAGSQKRRLVFTEHAELRMQERRIGRRQVLQTLQNGHISEPLHQDIRGDWRCNVSWFYAGVRLTVGVVFKLSDKGDWVVIATVFEG